MIRFWPLFLVTSLSNTTSNIFQSHQSTSWQILSGALTHIRLIFLNSALTNRNQNAFLPSSTQSMIESVKSAFRFLGEAEPARWSVKPLTTFGPSTVYELRLVGPPSLFPGGPDLP